MEKNKVNLTIMRDCVNLILIESFEKIQMYREHLLRRFIGLLLWPMEHLANSKKERVEKSPGFIVRLCQL